MVSFETVLSVATTLCVSGRGALLFLIVFPLTQLFAAAVHFLWKWWGLTQEKIACAVIAVAFGGSLWRCLCAVSAQNAADLGPVLPLCVLFLFCGFSAGTMPSWRKLSKSAAALVTVGCVRELLCKASLFSFPLNITAAGDVFGRSSDGSLGVGGLLVAAAIAWVLGLSFPLRTVSPPQRRELLFAALFTAAAGSVISLFPSLSVVWRFFVVFTATALCQAVCSFSLSPWLSFFPAITVCLPHTLTLPIAVGIGGVVFLICNAVPCIANRLARAPLPRRFAGTPLLLTLTALVGAILTAV